jgi:hypothetical protein
MSASPMGEMQSVCGGRYFTDCIPASSFLYCSSPRLMVFAVSDIPAFSQISLASLSETRLKSVFRKSRKLRVREARPMFMRVPSSTPSGWGRISFVAGGSLSVARL